MEINLAEGVGISAQTVMTGRGCAIGQSGSGKSYLAGVLAEELCRLGMPFLVVDTEGEYASLRSLCNVIVVGGERGDLALDVDFSRLFRASIEDKLPVVLDLSDTIEKKEVASRALSELYEVESRLRKPYLVLVEHCGIFYSTTCQLRYMDFVVMERGIRSTRRRALYGIP